MPPFRRLKAEDEATVEVEEEEAAEDEAEKALAKSGVYYVWSDITKGSLKKIHQDIMCKRLTGWGKNEPLQILINSDGGDLNETYSLIDLMDMTPWPIVTVGFGSCASAAAMLLASGTKGIRVVAPSTEIMIHAYSWGTAGKHKDLVAHRKVQDDSYTTMVQFWIKHSKHKTRKAVEKNLLRSEDVWLTPKEAIAHGIVDKISDLAPKPKVRLKPAKKL